VLTIAAMTPKEAIAEAISKMGGDEAAAAALGSKWPSLVRNWVSRGQVPARQVIRVSKLSGVPAHKLRPDMFPTE
jgi:DNA-binding transcriptional regulator YdaS (Cro superfamily)